MPGDLPQRMYEQAVAALAPVLPLLRTLGTRFADAGHELALVGGPVRDAFLGRTPPDLDFTTSARPDQIEAIVHGWADAHWDIGREFGTIGLRKGPHTIEITTYRADTYDRASRKPDVLFGDTLAGDLVRRDFTVNAMAIRLPGLDFVDEHGGIADLARGRLRTPAPAVESFADDPLRMMRAARFAAQLGFSVSAEVYAAMIERAETLRMVSAERIRDEFVKLLCAPAGPGPAGPTPAGITPARGPRAGVALLVDTGLAEIFLPELPALKLEVDEHHRHKDVYEHSLTVLDQAIALEGTPNAERDAEPDGVPDAEPDGVPGPDLVLRLAALLHDIGKPATRRFEPGGGVSFHHHELVGARLVAKRLKAMRFDKDTVKAVSRLVELHLRFHGYGEGQWTDSAVRRYVTDAADLLPRLHLLTRSDCTTRNARKAQRLAFAYDDLERRIAELSAAEELAAVRPELDGNQIGAVLGIPPGPDVGRAYRFLLGVRLDEGPIGTEAATRRLLDWWNAAAPDNPDSAPR